MKIKQRVVLNEKKLIFTYYMYTKTYTRVHNSSRNNQKISGEKVMALLFSDLEDEQEKDEEEEDYYDNFNKMSEVEEEDYYIKMSEVELATVTNSLCEGKMNFTLHPGQMCAGGEEGGDYCKVINIIINQTVLQKLTSSDKVRAKQSLSLWWFVGKYQYTLSKTLPALQSLSIVTFG